MDGEKEQKKRSILRRIIDYFLSSESGNYQTTNTSNSFTDGSSYCTDIQSKPREEQERSDKSLDHIGYTSLGEKMYYEEKRRQES